MAGEFRLDEEWEVTTKFGKAALAVDRDTGCLVLRRHGRGDVLPHEVNHRANLSALKALGVRSLIATGAVGSLEPKLARGSLGLVSQFLDFTRERQPSLLEGRAAHVDVTEPYSPGLNDSIVRAAREARIPVTQGLVYVGVTGPRYETAAEVRMFRTLGGDVVGMTGVPEAVLAREAGLEYSSVVVVTNMAAGLQRKVSHSEVVEAMAEAGPRMRGLIQATIKSLPQGGGPA